MKRSILAKGKQVVEWLFFDSTDRLRRFTKSGKNAAEVIVINKGLSDGRRTGTQQTDARINERTVLPSRFACRLVDRLVWGRCYHPRHPMCFAFF